MIIMVKISHFYYSVYFFRAQIYERIFFLYLFSYFLFFILCRMYHYYELQQIRGGYPVNKIAKRYLF